MEWPFEVIYRKPFLNLDLEIIFMVSFDINDKDGRKMKHLSLRIHTKKKETTVIIIMALSLTQVENQ